MRLPGIVSKNRPKKSLTCFYGLTKQRQHNVNYQYSLRKTSSFCMLYFFMTLQTFLAGAIFLRTHFRVHKKDVTRLLL